MISCSVAADQAAQGTEAKWVADAYRKSCIERWLPEDLCRKAAALSITERYGSAAESAEKARADDQMKLALLRAYVWKPGRSLTIGFLDGSQRQRAMVIRHAREWEEYANISFNFVETPQAEIRISFNHDPGSWSMIGTMALVTPKDQPTMNFGWLRDDTDESEANRVVVHEFGHCLGAIHEHQHPLNGIPWNKERVYEFYAKPPNSWPREVVDRNIFQRFELNYTITGIFDPRSIMMYPIPPELTDGKFQVGLNTDLSLSDKMFIRIVYPRR
jgi:hypothetical protein